MIDKPRQLPELPAPGAPPVKTPEFKRAFVGSNVQLTPAAFSFSGNTIFSNTELQPLVASFVNKPSDVNGLLDAANAVRNFYRARGHLLTEVYIPEQSFAATGGTVELAVVEARIGKVRVTVKEGAGVSQAFAERLLANHLHAGDPITEYSLDKPILLLRDTVRVDASASVVPGALTGLADIVVEVLPQGKFIDGSVSFDNMGAISAGEYRLTGAVNVNAPLGIGDQLALSVQPTNASKTHQYRFYYGAPINGWGTKAGISYSVNDYGLGKQFAELGATGSAKVASFSLIHPLIRGRKTNLFIQGGFDNKQLRDDVVATGNVQKKVDLFRLGVLGNHSDEFLFAGGFNSFALSVSNGKLELSGDPAVSGTPANTDAASSGPQTAGRFSKVNAELQRVQYFGPTSSLLLLANMQFASKNLTSAEKMSLGGPTGVRGYPIGEANGDEGVLLTAEFRQTLPFQLMSEPISATVFYDYGTVKVDKVRSATVNANTNLGSSRLTIDSLGVGFYAGTEGRLLLTGGLAVRVGGPTPTTGDPDRRPRVWFSASKWF